MKQFLLSALERDAAIAPSSTDAQQPDTEAAQYEAIRANGQSEARFRDTFSQGVIH
jgi:hypothetical protein